MASEPGKDEAASNNPDTYIFVHGPDPNPFSYAAAHRIKIRAALAPIDDEPWAEALKQIEGFATDYRNILAARTTAPKPGEIAKALEGAATDIARLVGENRDGKFYIGWLGMQVINDALHARAGEWWRSLDLEALNERLNWLGELRDQLRKAAQIERQHKPRAGASLFVFELLQTWVALGRPVSGQGVGFPKFVSLCAEPIPGATTSMSKVVREVVGDWKTASQP